MKDENISDFQPLGWYTLIRPGVVHFNRPLTKIKAECEARESAFSDVPENKRYHIKRLYMQLVENRTKAAPGKRNELTIQMVTFLHDAVCRELAMRFCAEFWKQNQVTWHDPLEQHLDEAAAHWDALEEDYPNRLSSAEAEVYLSLPEREQAFFRICRSFAYPDGNPAMPDGERLFSLPMAHHGIRLNLDGKQVSRLIDTFIRWGVFVLVKKGTQNVISEGKLVSNGEAGVYRWLLEGKDEHQ